MKQIFAFLFWAGLLGAADLRVAAFRADVTPRSGEPLIWITPVKTVLDPLLAKGVVIQNGRERYVLCAIDWCGLGNRAHALFRETIAKAVDTMPERVELHSIHQHTAPYVDASATDLLRESGQAVPAFSDESLAALAARIGEAARTALGKLEQFDRVGVSLVRVDKVASARRLHGTNGELSTRFSTSGKNPVMAAAPEGDIDPDLHTITLAHGSRPLVRMHFYASHPQTFCCEGTVTADFVGAARERFEREDGIPQVYFTGAAGDVTVGKYNDGSAEARAGLAERMHAALKESAVRTKFVSANDAGWTGAALRLPRRQPGEAVGKSSEEVRYRRAITEVFSRREQALGVTLLRIGSVRMLFLPGEPMLEFQRFAEGLSGKAFLAFAGYGDIAPGYLCTDKAYAEGGYEPSASNTAPGAEAAIKSVIRSLVGSHL